MGNNFLLVSDKSVENILPVTIESLKRRGNAKSIAVVVPSQEISRFSYLSETGVSIISEDEILPHWCKQKIRDRIKMKDRAGWYLQQFLKLAYGTSQGLKKYVIWDSDTVLIRNMVIESGDIVNINLAREYHKPYFETFKKITGYKTVLGRSAISQYIQIHTEIVEALINRICTYTGDPDWVNAILSRLDGKSQSEFSEYETYANFVAVESPDRIKLVNNKWFRNGSDVVKLQDVTPLMSAQAKLHLVEKLFSGFNYVAFERHNCSRFRRIASHLMLHFKVGS